MWTLRLPLSSQTTARRNAQRAAIECGIRRRQREDVEQFFQRRHQQARAAALSRARREAARRSGYAPG
jgi:hypothetical protein